MDEKYPEVTPDPIVDAVLEGTREGEATFGVKVTNILFQPGGGGHHSSAPTIRRPLVLVTITVYSVRLPGLCSLIDATFVIELLKGRK